MKHAIILLALGSAILSAASANPVAMVDTEKTWERCVVSVGSSKATVSCAVGYKAVSFANAGGFMVHVPIFWGAGETRTADALLAACNPRLEIGGKILKPMKIEFSENPEILPKGTVMAFCWFYPGEIPAKDFGLVVTYDQPLLDGRAYYQPLFEKDKGPTAGSPFSVTFFPSENSSLALESKHRHPVTALATRITVTPQGGETIIVKPVKPE